jgi:hypothetical protein
VDVGEAEIHVVAFDSAGHATDEDHGAVRLLPLDDPDVRQWVVHLAVTIIVPCIIEEDEIARVGDWSLVECTLLLDVRMDDPDSVGVRVDRFTVIKINPMSEKNCTSHSGTIISDAPAIADNRFGTGSTDRQQGYSVGNDARGRSFGCVAQPTSVTMAIVAMIKKNRIASPYLDKAIGEKC